MTPEQFYVVPEIESLVGCLEREELSSLNSLSPQTRDVHPIIEPAAYCGFAGQIVDAIAPYSEGDPIAILVNLLTAYGNVVGPTAHFLVERTEHHLNLFCVQVGKTAKGRKGTAWSTPRFMFEAIDADWTKKRIRSGLSSGEGLVFAVRDPRYESRPAREKNRTVDYERVLVDAGEDDKRLLCVEEEFSQCLKVMMREGNILSPILRDAWDGKKLAPMTKHSPIEATDAHVSIIAHITRDELLRYFTATEQTNGFGNRFMWFFVKRSREIPTPTGCPDEILNPLIEQLSEAVAFGRSVITINRDAEAEVMWQEVYHHISAEKDGLLGALLARSEAQVMRLACIYALLNMSDRVTAEYLEAALALWSYVEQSCQVSFGGLKGDPNVDKAFEALKTAGRLTTTDLHALFGKHAPKTEIQRIMTEVSKFQNVSAQIEKTAGRRSSLLIWTAKDAK